MKKTKQLLLALCAIALTGCSEAQSSDGKSYLDRTMRCEKINRYGHSYLMFYHHDKTGFEVTHDPDCPCHKKGDQQ